MYLSIRRKKSITLNALVLRKIMALFTENKLTHQSIACSEILSIYFQDVNFKNAFLNLSLKVLKAHTISLRVILRPRTCIPIFYISPYNLTLAWVGDPDHLVVSVINLSAIQEKLCFHLNEKLHKYALEPRTSITTVSYPDLR